ncbi:universal stress protein [Streptomyces sp. NPDC023723]|uniref:universal stress protein n=1 Tax=Streptomyces sp. NPDC023723 TaxID=3154323 RepID=UPI0033C33ACB
MTELPLVVGVDGSESSRQAVDWAADQAARHGRPLRLLHATHWERYEETLPTGGLERPSAPAVADHIVEDAARRARRRRPGVEVSAEAVADDPAGALLRAGDHASSLVVGERGRGELKGLLLGSVSLAVAARARCPVIVVRGDQAGLAGTHERVLLGAGQPDTGGEAARFAFREAEARGCVLDVVRAWRCPVFEGSDHPALADDPAHQHEEQASALLDAVLRGAGSGHERVRVRGATTEGPAHKVLVHRSAAADLVIVGARRRTGHFGLQLSRVSHTLLHHAHCPVAVVPERN